MMDDPHNLLTHEESRRFNRALIQILGVYATRFSPPLDARFLSPIHIVEHCIKFMGARVFAQHLLRATLNIYHDAPEWVGVFYGVVLVSKAGRKAIVHDLITGPSDHRAFISKVLSEIEEEMLTQIATDFTRTPFDLLDRQSTQAFFDTFYRTTLHHIALVKKSVARRRLLL